MKNRLFICFLLLAIILQVVLFPTLYSEAFFEGLSLFYFKLLPVLLPFFVFCGVLVKTGVLLEISEKFFSPIAAKLSLSRHFPYVFILAILSGYPMNAKITKDLFDSGEISLFEGESIAFSTSTSGVIFVCATVGSVMLGSLKIGVILMACHVVSCLIGYFTFRIFDTTVFKNAKNVEFSKLKIKRDTENFNLFHALSESVSSALSSILLVGCYVCIFAVFCKMLENLGLFSHFGTVGTGVLRGIFEITMGISTLSSLEVSPLSLAFICSLICFGGISINLQSLGLLLPYGISARRYFILKTVQMCVGFLLAFFVFLCLGY